MKALNTKISKEGVCVYVHVCVREREKERHLLMSYALSFPLSSLLSVYCALVARSCLTLATPWTVSCQAPPSIGFPRQEHWSGSPRCACKDKHNSLS